MYVYHDSFRLYRNLFPHPCLFISLITRVPFAKASRFFSYYDMKKRSRRGVVVVVVVVSDSFIGNQIVFNCTASGECIRAFRYVIE